MNGAKIESIRASASALSRITAAVAGSDSPPPSIALRTSEVSSISRAIVTLNRLVSAFVVASAISLCAAARNSVSPAVGSDPSATDPTSAAARQTRASHLTAPVGETSAQSMSSSGGPANSIVTRTASGPYFASSSCRLTRLPVDFDIAEPSMITWPWLVSRVNGSVKSTMPMSLRALVRKREYNRCRIACSTPPMYSSTGSQSAVRCGSNGADRSSTDG